MITAAATRFAVLNVDEAVLRIQMYRPKKTRRMSNLCSDLAESFNL
jgi:hypothetical protein